MFTLPTVKTSAATVSASIDLSESQILSMATACRRDAEKLALLKALDLDSRMLALSVWQGTKTSTRYIPIKLENGRIVWISDPMRAGNSKVAPAAWLFDLPAVESCGNCESCEKTCYAVVQQNQYLWTFAKRSSNYWLAMNQQDLLFALLDKQLSKGSRNLCRPHASGEFFCQNYVDMWEVLSNSNRNVNFWAYTKMENFLNFSAIDAAGNFNLIRSFLPDGSLNYGEENDIVERCKAQNVPVCPYREKQPKEARKHCAGSGRNGCRICMHARHVGFVIHGSKKNSRKRCSHK